MNTPQRKRTDKKRNIIFFIILILAFVTGAGLDVAIRPTEEGDVVIDTSFSMHLSSIQQPALLENANGEEVVTENIVTIEEISNNQLIKECPEEEECGQGKYIYAPTDTPQAFKDYTLDKCWNTDGYYSAQCFDLADLFWQNYAGRNFSSCGTGAAKGAWNCKEYNAGDDFELITNEKDLQAGDWIIFSSGKYGHVGMALGSYNNGYITLLGQNQGGASCNGEGGATNIINISLKSFVGAFRPKSYIKVEPTPIPISNCVKWHVLKGDTMSKIMLECEGTVVYGEPMNAYAKTWYSLVIKPNQSVYDGWVSEEGVGLYENDDIEHRIK